MVTEVDVYQEIQKLQLEGVVSKREAARRLGISRNTVKKYWDGDDMLYLFLLLSAVSPKIPERGDSFC